MQYRLYGPKGPAALYVLDGTPFAATTTRSAQERGLRAGTENVAAIVGCQDPFYFMCDPVEEDPR